MIKKYITCKCCEVYYKDCLTGKLMFKRSGNSQVFNMSEGTWFELNEDSKMYRIDKIECDVTYARISGMTSCGLEFEIKIPNCESFETFEQVN